LLVADLIWLARLRGEPPPDLALDDTVHEEFAALRKARLVADEALISFVAGLDDAALAGTISYTTVTQPTTIRQPVGAALLHVFNHQTHHRGQCHAMMTRVAGEAPSLDLIVYQRESGVGLAP
jgi:uncharacterized damage-inducible protein DinB